MQESRKSLYFLFIMALLVTGLFFLLMYFNGNSSLSSNSQDWGAFGSYVGGVLGPISSFVAGYLIYNNLKADAYYKKLEIIRESLIRLDAEMNENLDKPTRHSTQDEKNVSVRKLIILASNNEIEVTNEIQEGVLSMLHNLGIISLSIQHYLELLQNFESHRGHSSWMVETEKAYWVARYSTIAKRMCILIGMDKVRSRFSKEQLISARLLGLILE